MSEEVKNPEANVARAMIYAMLINGLLGFAALLTFLFRAGSLEQLMESGAQYPFINILTNSLGNSATTVIVSLVTVIDFCCRFASISSGSRMVWSFARDQGLPFWKHIRKVGDRSKMPVATVLLVIICAALLGLIQIGSSTAFNDVLSLVLEGFYSSYLCALLPLLYHRVRGNIAEPQDVFETLIAGDSSTSTALTWEPWRVKGWLGVVNNTLACIYLLVVGLFGLWPPEQAVTAETMNYASAVLGTVAVGSGVYYLGWARYSYSGPIVELEVERISL